MILNSEQQDMCTMMINNFFNRIPSNANKVITEMKVEEQLDYFGFGLERCIVEVDYHDNYLCFYESNGDVLFLVTPEYGKVAGPEHYILEFKRFLDDTVAV